MNQQRQPAFSWDEASDPVATDQGFAAYESQMANPEKFTNTVYITEVTLRDGEQQQTDPVTIEQRLDVFDQIVSTGVDRIEIGHLGNSKGDQQLAAAIVKHVAEKEQTATGQQYANVKLQVLFGSQQDVIRQGITVLEEAFKLAYGNLWQQAMNDKIVVHVYDRIDENLRNTASTPYSDEESAKRVCEAAQYAIDSGFTNFSISGEAATAVTADNAIQYYRSINNYLFAAGAQTVNVNLANTYGFSAGEVWNAHTLAIFNNSVKYGYYGAVSTSIHAHNDTVNAVDFSVDAITAGFDRVEGTYIGMGERAGNTPIVDVYSRLIEISRQKVESSKMRGRVSGLVAKNVLRRTVKLAPDIVNNLDKTYGVCEKLAKIYGEEAKFRWHKTALGNPHAFDNGSGPHDQAMARAIEDPVQYPPYKNYEWFLAVASIMGRKIADKLAIGDPEAVKEVTVDNHAGGGKTQKIVNGEITRTDEVVEEATKIYKKYQKDITKNLKQGVPIG